MQAVRANLAPTGRVYLNYDSGHFGADATPGERVKGAASRVLARVGYESRYRKVVRDDEFESLLRAAGLHIGDEKGFNTDVKVTFRAVPESTQDLFMERWLEFELSLNNGGLSYDPRIFRTRNVVLDVSPNDAQRVHPSPR